MLLLLLLLAALCSAQHPLQPGEPLSAEEQRAATFVARAEEELLENTKKATVIEWAYYTNITDHNEKVRLDYQKVSDALSLKLGKEAKQFDVNRIRDRDVRRKLEMISQTGTSILPDDKRERYNQLSNDLLKLYSTATVPGYKDKSEVKRLEPDLTLIMSDSRDAKELEYYWTQWREATGKKMRELYMEQTKLLNEAARLNGYRDATEMKIQPYESDTFVEEMAETWRGLKPLYEQLHAYVRNKLAKKYGSAAIKSDGPIPAHLLGNMWAQSWGNLADILRPYPNKPDTDVTDAMVEQGWTATKMFEKADEFFQSMGLDPMTKTFWDKSVLEKPADGRDLVCHASAWDFYTENDFRIKQCTRVTQDDFITVNHEMGHTQYQMSYSNLSYLFRNGANPGFHEGVADILGLAVGTATYYQRLGLLDKNIDITDEETNINILFKMALEKLVFMPFGYLVDKYRWDVYSGWADENNMNCHWHKLRADIQGVAPPVVRDEMYFDPGAKYHVAGGVGYIRYFNAHVYEFQFYRELCRVSGQYDPNDPNKPLHRCNFYDSKVAGQKLLSMLVLGSSKPWKEVMEVMTGKPEMSTEAFREYFKPLEDWLRNQNAQNGVHVGWRVPDYEEYCKSGKVTGGSNIATPSFFGLVLALAAVFFRA